MKLIRITTTLLLLGLLWGCQKESKEDKVSKLVGKWKGIIGLNDGKVDMPFLFELKKADNEAEVEAYLINGADEELILIDNITFTGDSLIMPMHIFDAELRAKVGENGLEGEYVKIGAYGLPFKAEKGTSRFDIGDAPVANITGKWKVTFTKKDGGETPAIGVFKQNDSKVTGTFLTKTGDYRFLEGVIDGKTLKLSTFDGTHAYLFTAEVADGKITNGQFWSGKTGYRTWEATLDPGVELPDPTTLTHLKEGYESLSFSFPNLEGKQVSLEDEKFKDKVVIVQILGSWCPNCMDETKFLAPFYKQYKDKGVEVIGLGYENTDDFEVAKKKLERMKKRFDIQYELLYAGQPSEAAASLPMLNHVMSFPTSIIIDRSGKVRQIHTGFSGPGTGEYYEHFVEEFTLLIDKLVEEK
ncbi:TlpA disulfide reductase family protein [Algivirga pacifica]|uniref:Thioredoxin domain-containing protein n=1 Tax=Algivirga pacifica TaxID=1162670 RepID=A0ABP9CYS8_9BACT